MTAEEYPELIQLHVDQARSDSSIAERLSEEARQRFGATIDVPRGDRVMPVGRWTVEERQRARAEFDVVASITPPDYDPTFDNEAIQDVGHLDGACDDVLELAARWPAEGFADRYHSRRTIPDLLPNIAKAAAYLTTVLRHLEERIG